MSTVDYFTSTAAQYNGYKVTPLRPERYGIFGNSFINPTTNIFFNIQNTGGSSANVSTTQINPSGSTSAIAVNTAGGLLVGGQFVRSFILREQTNEVYFWVRNGTTVQTAKASLVTGAITTVGSTFTVTTVANWNNADATVSDAGGFSYFDTVSGNFVIVPDSGTAGSIYHTVNTSGALVSQDNSPAFLTGSAVLRQRLCGYAKANDWNFQLNAGTALPYLNTSFSNSTIQSWNMIFNSEEFLTEWQVPVGARLRAIPWYNNKIYLFSVSTTSSTTLVDKVLFEAWVTDIMAVQGYSI